MPRTPVKTTLPNGLTLIVEADHSAPVVAMQAWIRAGSADETEAEGGLAHVHEHMLFKGTATRKVGQIAAEIEGAGGEINAWTSFDETVYHVVMASRHFDTGLDVLADALRRSSFDPDELSRELEVILEEIKRSDDQPGRRVSRGLFESVFTAHPYRRPVIGHAEVVKAFTREQILDFYARHYRPERMVVVVVGDVTVERAQAAIEAAFGDMEPGAPALPPRPSEPAQTAARVCGLTDDVKESHLALGFRIPGLGHDDAYALDILSLILGQGESSRLVQRLRKDLQLVNDCSSYAYTPKDEGVFVLSATLDAANIPDVVAAFGEQLAHVRAHGVLDEELDKARTLLEADAVYQMETCQGRARRLGYWETVAGDVFVENTYTERLKAVTSQDIRDVVERLLVPERANLVALVPDETKDAASDEALLSALEGLAPLAAPVPETAHVARTGKDVTEVTFGHTRLLLCPSDTLPAVALRAVWHGGLRTETDETAGFGHLLARQLTRGTARHTARTLAARIEGMGGSLSAFSGRNSFGLRAAFLKSKLQDGLDITADTLRTPAFDGDELALTQKLILNDLKTRFDDPAGLAYELFARSLWPTHPYRRDVQGTPTSVAGATPERLRAFYGAQFPLDDAVVCVVGDFDAVRIEDWARETFARADAPGQRNTQPTLERDPVPSAPKVARLMRDRAQAHLMIGNMGITLDDEDRFALEVLIDVLSGQGGRLFYQLRDKQSLCYAVSAFNIEGVDPGLLGVYMGTSPDKVDEALAGIDALLDDVTQNGITAAELDAARAHLLGVHDIGLQKMGARASSMALNHLYGLGYDADKQFAARLDAVTLEDVRRVAQRLLVPDQRVISIVGPEGTGGPAATEPDAAFADLLG